MVSALASELGAKHGIRTAVLSIDDLYYGREVLDELGRTKFAGNRLLSGRGLPGTHDVELGKRVLSSLIHGRGDGIHGQSQGDAGEVMTCLSLPRYDKSAYKGRGDRLPIAEWPRIDLPVDVVLFEGWMLGYVAYQPEARFVHSLRETLHGPSSTGLSSEKHDKSTTEEQPEQSLLNLAQVNEELHSYATEWYPLLDAFIQIYPLDFTVVYEWREQQECALRHAKAGMSEVEVRRFVDRFWPCYALYNMPEGKIANGGTVMRQLVAKGRFMRVVIDRQRAVVKSSLLGGTGA